MQYLQILCGGILYIIVHKPLCKLYERSFMLINVMINELIEDTFKFQINFLSRKMSDLIYFR